jgi:hypothetical protein
VAKLIRWPSPTFPVRDWGFQMKRTILAALLVLSGSALASEDEATFRAVCETEAAKQKVDERLRKYVVDICVADQLRAARGQEGGLTNSVWRWMNGTSPKVFHSLSACQAERELQQAGVCANH